MPESKSLSLVALFRWEIAWQEFLPGWRGLLARVSRASVLGFSVPRPRTPIGSAEPGRAPSTFETTLQGVDTAYQVLRSSLKMNLAPKRRCPQGLKPSIGAARDGAAEARALSKPIYSEYWVLATGN